MRLTYKILWFEDDESVITTYQGPVIVEFLTELGFTPVIVHRTNAEDLGQLMESHEINSYDLIVSDYNLDDSDGQEIRGNVIIERLRLGHILTEVLLYSSQPNFVKDVIEKQGWVERASYCAGRPNLEQKLKDVISLTVRKQQDVNNTRGLVIAETIILENKISNILSGYFEATADTALSSDKLALLESIKQHRLKYNQEHVEFLSKLTTVNLSELIEKGILTANNTLDALRSVLKQRNSAIGQALTKSGLPEGERKALNDQQSTVKSLQAEMELFKVEIVDIRNTLAHVVESVGEDGVPFLESRVRNVAPVKFDAVRYTQIRKDLHKHNQNLDFIKEHLSGE